jgi:hypothetical protein
MVESQKESMERMYDLLENERQSPGITKARELQFICNAYNLARRTSIHSSRLNNYYVYTG